MVQAHTVYMLPQNLLSKFTAAELEFEDDTLDQIRQDAEEDAAYYDRHEDDDDEEEEEDDNA